MGVGIGISLLRSVRVVGVLFLIVGCLLAILGSDVFIQSLYERWVVSALSGEGAITVTGRVETVDQAMKRVTYSFHQDGRQIEKSLALPDVSEIDVGAPVTLRCLHSAPSVCRPTLVYPTLVQADRAAVAPRTEFLVFEALVLWLSGVPGLLLTMLGWPLILYGKTWSPGPSRSNLNIRGMMISGFEIGLAPFPLFAILPFFFAPLAVPEVWPLLIVCAGIVSTGVILFLVAERLKKRFGQQAARPRLVWETEAPAVSLVQPPESSWAQPTHQIDEATQASRGEPERDASFSEED